MRALRDRDPESSGYPLLPAWSRGMWQGEIVLATRRPTVLLRFPVLLLLRWAARRFRGLLFVTLKACVSHDEPPRRTRRQGAVQGGD